MSDSRVLFISRDWSSAWNYDIFKRIRRNFSVEEENFSLEQEPYWSILIFSLCNLMILFCVLKFFRNISHVRFLFVVDLLFNLSLDFFEFLMVKLHFILIFNWWGRVRKSYIRVKFEVDEFKKLQVKLKESVHDAVINIKGKSLGEFVRNDPSNWLPHNFYLIVNSFNAEKSFSKTLAHSAIKHELSWKSLTLLYGFSIYLQH